MSKLSTYLSIVPLVAMCSLGLAVGANANPATAPAANIKSSPTFLGDGGPYPFSEAVRVGNTLYMSGQIGIKDGKLVKGGIDAETKQTLDNIQNTLSKYGYQKSDLIKCTAMLADVDDFDDFNKVYKMQNCPNLTLHAQRLAYRSWPQERALRLSASLPSNSS